MRKIKYSLSPSTRIGITRLEVIALFLIAFVVVGLILSFLSRLHETANQKTCADNLRRIGLAVLAYHQEKKFLPPARIAPDFATWAVVIAPYLQKDSGLDDWDLSKRFADQSEKARAAVLAAYFCPSRERETLQSIPGALPGHDPVSGALGDYACASGDGDLNKPWTGPLADGAMIIGEVLEEKDSLILRWKSRTTLASLTRGGSYTLLMGEKHVPLDKLAEAEAGDSSLYNGGRPASSARVGGPGFGLAQTPFAPFNANFGSAHAGICQFLRADGSAQAYSLDMSEEVLGRMIRRE